MRTSVLCFLLSCCCCVAARGRFDPSTVKPIGSPPKRLYKARGLIEYYGYKSSEYTVETEDGYILSLIRMGTNRGPPVLMVNGFGVAPDGWLAYGPYHSLPYVLHDLGYDIWFPAKRGIDRKHKTLQWTDPKFWDFSHDEHGMYDMPPQIDVVVGVTGHKKLLYIGISQGGSIFMSLCNLRPEYCGLFIGSVQIVPAMNMPQEADLSPAAKRSWDLGRVAFNLSRPLGIAYLALDSETFQKSNICVALEQACIGLLNIITGLLPEQIYKGWLNYMLPLAVGGGASIKQSEHYLQMADKGGAAMFDYGPKMNMDKYGQPTPPSYDLSKIKSPTLIIYSLDDYYIPVPTMKRIAKQIGKNVIMYPAKDPTYGHIALAVGVNVYKQYYAKIVDFLDSLTGCC